MHLHLTDLQKQVLIWIAKNPGMPRQSMACAIFPDPGSRPCADVYAILSDFVKLGLVSREWKGPRSVYYPVGYRVIEEPSVPKIVFDHPMPPAGDHIVTHNRPSLKAAHFPDWMGENPRENAPWSDAEDLQLLSSYRLSRAFGHTPEETWSQLVRRHGRTEDELSKRLLMLTPKPSSSMRPDLAKARVLEVLDRGAAEGIQAQAYHLIAERGGMSREDASQAILALLEEGAIEEAHPGANVPTYRRTVPKNPRAQVLEALAKGPQSVGDLEGWGPFNPETRKAIEELQNEGLIKIETPGQVSKRYVLAEQILTLDKDERLMLEALKSNRAIGGNLADRLGWDLWRGIRCLQGLELRGLVTSQMIDEGRLFGSKQHWSISAKGDYALRHARP